MLYVRDWRKNTGMTKYRIKITELAENDLENISDYIAFVLKNYTAAKNVIKGIRAEINSLVNYPERNGLAEDEILAEKGIRIESYKNYKIFYVIEDENIYIVRILHMKMDSKSWLYKTFKI